MENPLWWCHSTEVREAVEEWRRHGWGVEVGGGGVEVPRLEEGEGGGGAADLAMGSSQQSGQQEMEPNHPGSSHSFL